MATIYIQIQTAGHARWDDVPATLHEVRDVETTTQAIADATGCPVRFCYPLNNLPVGNLNGGYARPKMGTSLKSNHFYLSVKALNVVQTLHDDFPEMNDEGSPVDGSDAVDGLCRIWPEVKYLVDSSKNS